MEHVVRADYIEPSKEQQIETFNKTLDERLDDTNFRLTGDMDISRLYLDDKDDPDKRTNIPTDEEYGDMLFEPRPDEDDEESVDKYLNMELILDLGNDNEWRGHVCKCARNNEGEPIGHAHSNPLFDTHE